MRLVQAIVAGALVSSTAGQPIVTQAWSGRTLSLAAGKSATLRLSSRWRWTAPEVTGAAIRLVRVDYDRDPGYREWTIHARRAGDATVRSTGRPGSKRFVLHVHVG